MVKQSVYEEDRRGRDSTRGKLKGGLTKVGSLLTPFFSSSLFLLVLDTSLSRSTSAGKNWFSRILGSIVCIMQLKPA